MLNAGDLDPTFGAGGKVLTDFVGPIDAVAAATVIQPDGKIVVAGTGKQNSGELLSINDFLLARYNPDGSLDVGFGTGGSVSTEFFAGRNGVTGVALQPDGKIIVVGDSQGNNVNSVLFAVARYTAGGHLDASFGTGGMVTTDLGSVSAATGVVIQPDGKIVVVGNTGMFEPSSAVVVRYNGDGHLDPTFGTGGKVITPSASARGVVLQPDGKIVVVGGSTVVRYNPDGSPDTGFGVGGKTMLNFGFGFGVSGAALSPDGKIVVVGTIAGPHGLPSTPVIVRLTPNGSLDSSFGGGEITAAVTSNGVAIQSDGRIIVVGRNYQPSLPLLPPDPVFAVARYNADGGLDTGFGTGGKASVVIGSNDAPAAVAVHADGKIVAVGSADDPKHTDFALTRFSPNGSLDTGFGGGGKVTTGFIGTVNSSATGVAVQGDGKIIVAGSAGVNFALTRYTADGSLDAMFGAGGRVSTDVGLSKSFRFSRVGVAIQADGKIVVAGSGTQGSALLRYNADGSLDPTFGRGGKVTDVVGGFASGPVFQADGKILVLGRSLSRFNGDGSFDTAFGTGGGIPVINPRGVALQPDGKILVDNLGGSNAGLVQLTRYNSDGSLDAGFGTGGMVSISPGGGSGIAVQPDGKIVLGSPVVRYNPDGSLDVLFGANGRGVPNFAGGRIAIAPDGKIIFGGVAVYKPNGTLDVRFGSAGMIRPDFAPADFALQPDGKMVIAGTTTASGHTSFTVARYLTTGGSSLSPNQLFVAQVYPDLLQRVVDPTGLAFWSGLLDRGFARAQVVQGIQGSSEYRTVIVRDLYRRVLGRFPDEPGKAAWVNFLSQGGTAEQLEAFLLGSEEFFIMHGSDVNKGFLPALYQFVFNRPIDASGAQSWGQVLASGTSRAAVATAILASPESDRIETQTLYGQFLHRPPDVGGFDAFTNLLQQGVPNEKAIGIIVSSDEYFAQT